MSNNTFQTPQSNNRLALVDILRVFLALFILSGHAWVQLSQHINNGVDLSPGYIAVEPFFMLSGYFLAYKAQKTDAIPWYRYSWRRLWGFLPVFTTGILFGFLGFSIASLIMMQTYLDPLTKLVGGAWFMWWLFISSAIIYPIIKKAKNKFAFFSIFIAVGLYFVLFYLDGFVCANNSHAHTEYYWSLLRKFIRSFSGLLLGTFIFACANKMQKYKIHKTIKFIFSVVGIMSLLGVIFVHVIYTRSEFDFLVILLFFMLLFIVFSNLGLLSERIQLPSNVCVMFRQISYISYIIQWAPISVMMLFGVIYPTLLDTNWWLALYGIVCYASVIILSFPADKIQLWLKKFIFDRIPVFSKI